MSIDSKRVLGRRQLRFGSLSDVVLDAERLVAAPSVRMLGNWPLDQLLMHLAVAINGSIDGISGKAHWLIRLAGPLIKRRIIQRGMSPGFRLPTRMEAAAFPASPSTQAALEKLRSAVLRTHVEPMTARHPVFGPMRHEEWLQFHLRHAELHLSFVLCE